MVYPDLVEPMTLGLMTFFYDTVERIKSLSAKDESERFKKQMKNLSVLEEHGFNVEYLRSCLEKLLHMKNKSNELQDAIKEMEEKITLKEINSRQCCPEISTLYTAIHQLEREAKLCRCILNSSVSQKMADDLEASRLKTKVCDLELSHHSIVQQFKSLASAPW